jgi:Papain-like cysteine protease AvrRpt2
MKSANPNRRDLFRVALAAAAGMKLSAASVCGPLACRSEIDFDEFAQEAFETQHMSEWCWAASISMIFSFHGHPVSQERIVKEVYGAVVNMPSGYGALMAALLNRSWTDDNGDRFCSRLTGVYDASAGVGLVNNVMLVRELDQNRPVLVGAAGHAVVLAMMEYTKAFGGIGQVTRCGVFDPWPGRGARDLTRAEMAPLTMGGALQFIATASIVD